MVGEIRDLEVGEIAIEAALTGHLFYPLFIQMMQLQQLLGF